MLSPTERRMLLKARERIVQRKDGYICNALNSVFNPFISLEVRAVERLKKYISQQLGVHVSLEGWQIENNQYCDKFQILQDRVAWIDWMLGK